MWVILITILCLDGYKDTTSYADQTDDMRLEAFTEFSLDNRIDVKGHDKCYVSYAEWLEQKSEQEQEQQKQEHAEYLEQQGQKEESK